MFFELKNVEIFVETITSRPKIKQEKKSKNLNPPTLFWSSMLGKLAL